MADFAENLAKAIARMGQGTPAPLTPAMRQGVDKLMGVSEPEGPALGPPTYEPGAYGRQLRQDLESEFVPRPEDTQKQNIFKTVKLLMNIAGLPGTGAPGVLAAVKQPGGMWHPEAVERLAQPLFQRLSGGGGDVRLAGIEPAYPHQQSNKIHADWTDRAIRNYLNKYAGTERDPLKDLQVPKGAGTVRWEDLTDALVKGRQVEGPKGLETQWNIAHGGRPQLGDTSQSSTTLTSYLSHVGDYLRQNVKPEELPRYDLVRAVRETHANDARVAKEMERASAASTASLPVHKDYGNGFKWVELKKPEKLTEEQGRGVRRATEHDGLGARDEFGMPGEMRRLEKGEEAYVALDAQGKPLRNSYTGDSAGGPTPEHAHLAGQLAQEGNQMGHCVGGYCEGVASGESRIFSLRDAKGRSHVTVEVAPQGPILDEQLTGMELAKRLGREKQQEIAASFSSSGKNDETLAQFIERAYPKEAKLLEQEVAPNISQIKGKQNRAPDAAYLPYVQDFVKSGKWGEVGDIRHTGLHDLKDLQTEHKKYGSSSRLAEFLKNENRFVTNEEHSALLAEYDRLYDALGNPRRNRGN